MNLLEEEWELINEDGFVYKRLKRRPIDPTVATAAPPDPAAEEKNHKERKKMILLKLKTSYQQEIQNWEHLSSTLKMLQNRTQIQPPTMVLLDLPDSSLPEHSSDYAYRETAETLMAQVEAQEAFIDEVSTLCDVAESLCNAQEQLLKQPLVYLPIWESSPRKLISLLCEECELLDESKLKFEALRKS